MTSKVFQRVAVRQLNDGGIINVMETEGIRFNLLDVARAAFTNCPQRNLKQKVR